jgi:hypothetical protein
MSDDFTVLTSKHRELGKQTYALWDDTLFAQLCEEPAAFFWEQSKQDKRAFEAYLNLLGEGVGAGYLTQSLHPGLDALAQKTKWRSLLEYWLVFQLPLYVPSLKADARLTALVKIWNLGENILHERSWVDPYLLQKVILETPPLSEIERHLGRWMEPLLAPQPVADWKPPFQVQVVDWRALHEDFLPGDIYLSGSSVVCVKDRRFDNLYGCIFLHEHPCTVLLHHKDLGREPDQDAGVHVEFLPSEARIKTLRIPLPFVSRVHSHLTCSNGALLVTAIDSQRLWLFRCQ